MVQIIETSKELTAVEKYAMTVAPNILVMKGVADGEVIPVKAWAKFVDKKESGEEVELLSILTTDNTAYSCQSATFKRSFGDILNCVGDASFAIVKMSGTTKAGRPYVNCVLDVNSVK